jgi:hypothetical protein
MRSDFHGGPAQIGRGFDYVYDERSLADFAALSAYDNQASGERVLLGPRDHATVFLALAFRHVRLIPASVPMPHVVSCTD